MNPTRRTLLSWFASVPVALRLAPAAAASRAPLEVGPDGELFVASIDEVYGYLRRFNPALFGMVSRMPFQMRSLVPGDSITITGRKTWRGETYGPGEESVGSMTFKATRCFSIQGGGR